MEADDALAQMMAEPQLVELASRARHDQSQLQPLLEDLSRSAPYLLLLLKSNAVAFQKLLNTAMVPMASHATFAPVQPAQVKAVWDMNEDSATPQMVTKNAEEDDPELAMALSMSFEIPTPRPAKEQLGCLLDQMVELVPRLNPEEL